MEGVLGNKQPHLLLHSGVGLRLSNLLKSCGAGCLYPIRTLICSLIIWITMMNWLLCYSCLLVLIGTPAWGQARPGNKVQHPSRFSGGELRVYATNLSIWPGHQTAVLSFNGQVPGPAIQVVRGSVFSARVVNHLEEPFTVHWHGILAPSDMDGHPGSPIRPGESRDISFPITQRAGTYWYHAHTDQLTARQAYLGLAGAFIVEDPDENRFGLPSADHDLLLLLADKRPTAAKQIPYAPTMMDAMNGYLGTEVVVNGTPDAWLSVDTGSYRIRLINGSNARIFKIALSNGDSFQVLANDSGLLPQTLKASSLLLPPGARTELLLSFSRSEPGSVVKLVSLPFVTSGTVGMGMGTAPQGTGMEILTFYVDRVGQTFPPISSLASFQPDNPSEARRVRSFSITTGGMLHLINGTTFSMERIDFTVPWDELEIWEFQNQTDEFHPMHPHAAQFQVLSRNGSTALPPEDAGMKDTVLVHPRETVRVLIRFNSASGLFVQHCHNLEHEDNGMMQNFAVEAPVRLGIALQGTRGRLYWSTNLAGYVLQTSSQPGGWKTFTTAPAVQGADNVLEIPFTGLHGYYRLFKP